MLDLYRQINKKLHLNFGNISLSPLFVLNVAVVYEHIEKFPTNHRHCPMFISLPTKEGVAALLPAVVLINMFFEDYIYRSGQLEQDLALKRGDLIEIFQTAAVFNRLDDKLELSFSDGGQYRCSRNYINFIKNTTKKQPNSYKLFNDKRYKFLGNPDALSRILEPKGDLPVPKASLKSVVMIVAGRGNVGKIRSSLSSVHIFGETLNKIVMEEDKLIIKQDLEEFLSLASEESEKAEQKFADYFSLQTSKLKSGELEECEGFEEINQAVAGQRAGDKDFKDLFLDFLDGLDPDGKPYQCFSALIKHLPIPSANIPVGLRAIFICDIKLYERYERTLGYLMKKGVPVICLADKLIESREDLDFFSNFFASRTDSVRLNWSRELISATASHDQHTKYIDHSFWCLAKRYANQQIQLKVYEDDGLEQVFEAACNVIKSLQGHEILIESFWKWLFPAWYIVKNCFGKVVPPLPLLDAFDDAVIQFQQLVPIELSKLSSRLRGFSFNRKLPEGDMVYSQRIMVRDKGLFTVPPVTVGKEKKQEHFVRQICFSGFPYREINHRPLWHAVFEDFVPRVHIALWPDEGRMTYNYLRTRILKSEMSTNIDDSSKMQQQIFSILSTDSGLEERIVYINPNMRTETPDEVQIEKNEIFHGPVHYHNNGSQGYQLACNILYFEEDLMYLPHQRTIYQLVDDGYGHFRLTSGHFDELRRGTRIVQFDLSRHDMRNYAKSDPTHLERFEKVDQWRKLIHQLVDEYNGDMNALSEYVETVSAKNDGLGSPNRHNLQRWRYDEDMIAPELENLKLLSLCIGNEAEEMDVVGIAEAAQILRSLSRTITKEVKTKVQYLINSSGKLPLEGVVKVNGVPVNVVSREIQGLEKSDVLVNYSDTRKILR